MTEAELVTAAAAGDERAFRALVSPYRQPVITRARRMLNDPELAEDVWQDVMFRVFRNLHRIDSTRNFGAWLWTIAINCVRNEIRNRQRRNRTIAMEELAEAAGGENRLLSMADDGHGPDELLDDRELGARIATAVRGLGKEHRDVFVLREMRGQSYDEIAESTRLKVGTVKSRLNRARSALAAALVDR